jgi:NADH-quinone oxidoreductase subunit L
VGIGIAYAKYIKAKSSSHEDAAITGFTKVLYDKYYVDEIYDFYSCEINGLSRFFRDNVETTLASVVLD